MTAAVAYMPIAAQEAAANRAALERALIGPADIRLREPDPYERRILTMLADGWEPGEIARALKIQPQTLRNRISNLIKIAGARNRIQLVAIAVRRGWIDEGPGRRAAA